MTGDLSLSSADLPNFSGVYVFGDSLVDAGNDLRAAEFLGSLPFVDEPEAAPTPDRGYFEGRFTDGYNFADLISNKLLLEVTKPTFPYGIDDPVLGIPITIGGRPSGSNLSFAYGGARAVGGAPAPDLDEQTDAYRHFPAGDPAALYLITIGGNDVRALVPTGGEPVVGDEAARRLSGIASRIANEANDLAHFGARHILVTGIPDVGLIPSYAGAPDEGARRALATEYSERLDSLVKGYLGALVLPEGTQIYDYDFKHFSDAVQANPAAFDLTDLTEARTDVQQGALDPVGSGFLFFDRIHPSAQTHALVAADILATLGGAPEGPVDHQVDPQIFALIEGAGASDDFTTSLVGGQSYVFDALGVSSGSGALSDPRLDIRDAAGAVLASDDDSGLGLDARLTFTAPVTGAYILHVSGVGVTRGDYVVQGSDLRGSDVRVQGGPLDDAIGAVSGSNILYGGDGADTIAGGAGFDAINGNRGNDSVSGGQGDDWVFGGKDNDLLSGGAGADILNGNLGADTCDGDEGDDIVRGGQQNDSVAGGAGNDFVSGDRGDDTVAGGAGADIFHTFGDAGLDRVVDFSPGEGDRVLLDPGTQYTVAQVGGDTVISLVGGAQMVLVGVSTSSLTGDWIFGA